MMVVVIFIANADIVGKEYVIVTVNVYAFNLRIHNQYSNKFLLKKSEIFLFV
jgi:hypothetical protein